MLDMDSNTDEYIPFIEVDIPEEVKVASLSSGIANIIDRAHQQVEIEWTPVKTVDGYLNSKGHL